VRAPWYWRRRPLALPASRRPGDATGELTVVHLVRAANGLGALRDFTQALRRHDPGVDYELVLAMKGFRSPADAAPHLEEAADLAPEALYFPDVGFDLGTFFGAASRLRRARYCFMNSWAHPLENGWLAKLNDALDRPGVGMVGSAGSWGSMHSWLTYALGLPSAYRAILPPRQEGLRRVAELERSLRGEVPDEQHGMARSRLRLLSQAPRILLDVEPFPCPHLRTAAFMISHEVLRDIELFPVTNNRVDTYALESGRRSLTRQVQGMGLRVLVVTRDASVYRPEEWDRSRTYRQGDQEGLLVGDRRTSEYARGTRSQRHLMASFCWGARADPGRSRQLSSVED
jgi:hypothetical protein